MSKKKKNKYFQDWGTDSGSQYGDSERDNLDDVRDLLDGKITSDEFVTGEHQEHLTYKFDKELENLVLGNDESEEDDNESFIKNILGEDIDDEDDFDDGFEESDDEDIDTGFIDGTEEWEKKNSIEELIEDNPLEYLCVNISTNPLIKTFHIIDRRNEIEMIPSHFNYYVEKYSANYDNKMNNISPRLFIYFNALIRKIISSRYPSAIFKTDEFVRRFALDKPYCFDDTKATIIQDNDYILVYIMSENSLIDILHKYIEGEVSDMEIYEAMIKLCYIADSLNTHGIGYTSFMDYELFESLYRDMGNEREKIIKFIYDNEIIKPIDESFTTHYPISKIDDIDDLFFELKKILLDSGMPRTNPTIIEIKEDDVNEDSDIDKDNVDDDGFNDGFEESDVEDDSEDKNDIDEEDDDVDEVNDIDNIKITIEDSEPVEETSDTSDDLSQTFTMENIPIYRQR